MEPYQQICQKHLNVCHILYWEQNFMPMDLTKTTEYMKDYLSHRKQQIQVKKTFSNWTSILHRVPRDSIFGPLTFNVFIWYLFLFIPNTDFLPNIVRYADDNNTSGFLMFSSGYQKRYVAWNGLMFRLKYTIHGGCISDDYSIQLLYYLNV